MEGQNSAETTEFDAYAADYDQALSKGLAISGEGKEFFASGRMTWLAGLVEKRGERPSVALDFGCGTGSATPFFFEHFRLETLYGTDVSEESLTLARDTWKELPCRFSAVGTEPEEAVDLAYCNGVFHHIPVAERAEAISRVFRSLKPGGLFALWENNPWNPVTRYAMSKVPFDRDAILLWPGETRRLLEAGGFEVLRTDFVFFFPRSLRVFRGVEPWLCKVPFGGQYLVLARKGG